jgi:murein DD-endopeptidase MepM/ murein hydrolase activator NlpD
MARRPTPALLALTTLVAGPLVTVPLVLAQTTPETVAPLEPAPVLAPVLSPVAPVSPPPGPVSPPAAAPAAAQSAPAATAGTSMPLRPSAEQLRPLPPRRFDTDLDTLVREGVVSPSEVRVRGTLINPGNLGGFQEGCRQGAFSARECGGMGVIVRERGGGAGDGSAYRGGSYGEAGGGGAGPVASYGGGERYGIDAAPLPPISVPVTALLSGSGGSFRLSDVFRVTPRPQAMGGNGNARLLFPLQGSAVVSSNFGWRLHPLLGTWLMHSGRDLAAPEGTPVLAALTGRVVSSGTAGGYGLAIELEHDGPRRRTLYGHLSELYVKEGETVRQGEVIGRVGSTGLSTGPHLHFELRLPQDGGWVATDPGDLDPGHGPAIADGKGQQGLPGLPGAPGEHGGPDAVAMLLGQLLQTLERPRSPLPLPGETLKLPPTPPRASQPPPVGPLPPRG